MQKNQDQGQPNETGRSQQQRQDVQNETSNRPEVENPQPNRKVEEPITGSSRGGMETGSEKNQNQTMASQTSGSGNSGNASNSGNSDSGSSNKDYQRSDAGLKGGRENEDHDNMSSREKTAQSDKGNSSNR